MKQFILAIAVFSSFAIAQNTTPRPYVRATGDAVVSVRPDQVKLTASVVNSASTAQEAADTNAGIMTKVISQLQTVVGNSPNAIKSTGYSVYPVTRTATNGTTVITSYTAQNTVEVTLTNILLASKVIDTAVQAGATNVGSLVFGLSDPTPVRLEALKKAAVVAKQKADAIASALGMKTLGITVLEESGSVGIRTFAVGTAASANSTPVQIGLVDVTANVTLQAEIQ